MTGIREELTEFRNDPLEAAPVTPATGVQATRTVHSASESLGDENEKGKEKENAAGCSG